MTPRSQTKPPKPITATYLERLATFYLQRYAASEHKLRQLLKRRVERNCRASGEDPAVHETLVNDVVSRVVSSGLVDDRSYATSKVASLTRRGTSNMMIRARLRQDGIRDELIAVGLEHSGHEDAQAAMRLAQRRRLGPWRLRNRADYRDKDIASLCRAGFSPSLARAVIDADRVGDDDAYGAGQQETR